MYQIDGNFDTISPPNSIESVPSLEDLYSFFETSVLSKPAEEEVAGLGNLNQSLREDVKMELDCQIKQELLEESEEIMIEKIVSFALRVLPKYTAWAKSQWANVGLNSSLLSH